jgi:hypothetical protein
MSPTHVIHPQLMNVCDSDAPSACLAHPSALGAKNMRRLRQHTGEVTAQASAMNTPLST